MLDDMVAVETVARPTPRSPDKPALDYLRASGAAPIFITEVDDVATIRTGSKVDPRAVVVFWIAEQDAKPVVKVARRLAGKDQNVGNAVVSLKKAAIECRATLTPHDVAMQRAAGAARKLDEYLTSLKGTGVLKEFTRAYKRRRLAAMADGRGFMPYRIALARLRLALVPLLMNNGTPAVGASLFTEVFGATA